nr:putative disease resistance RPP13-like protein 1 [Ziziphus jujuba var. spinosa]
MAATLVGGAFLSASLQVLFGRLASYEVVDYLQGNKSNHTLCKKLKIMLLSVNAVLNDTEDKQIRNPAVKEWLNELEDSAHDADDLLDENATNALQFKLKVDQELAQVSSYDLDMEVKLEETLERLEFVVKQMDVLGLKEGVGGVKISSRIPTTSLMEETEIYGRDGDKGAIVKLLLREDVGSNKLCVFPIGGMRGAGKTTLAQLVYNDEKINEYFDLKSWVCVSEGFDI